MAIPLLVGDAIQSHALQILDQTHTYCVKGVATIVGPKEVLTRNQTRNPRDCPSSALDLSQLARRHMDAGLDVYRDSFRSSKSRSLRVSFPSPTDSEMASFADVAKSLPKRSEQAFILESDCESTLRAAPASNRDPQ